MKMHIFGGILTNPSPESSVQRSGSAASVVRWDSPWGFALLSFGVSFLLFVFVFRDPIGDAVWLWSNRSTYNHCFLIIPISLYLLWEERHDFFAKIPQPSFWGLGVLAVFLVLWALAATANILEGEHIALVGLLQGLLLTIFGADIYKRHWLAFCYLWLLVPSGEFVLPMLRTLAALQSEWLLEIAQIPVYLENYTLETPTGRYFVADGCAGLNFLLSAVALTPIYGMLMYRGWTKRLVALGLMIVIAIIANAVRIFLIIALAEYSDKQIDIVDDHIVYGWGFFAIILLIMGYIGYRFADQIEAPVQQLTISTKRDTLQRKRIISGTAALILMLSVSTYVTSLQGSAPQGTLSLPWPDNHQGWQKRTSPLSWQLGSPNADYETTTGYIKDGDDVIMSIAYFWYQDDGHELLSSQHQIDRPGYWTIKKQTPMNILIDNQSLPVIETILQGPQAERIVWHSYWIGGTFTNSKVTGIAQQVLQTLTQGETRSAIVSFSTHAQDDRGYARDRLRAFLSSGFPYTRLLEDVAQDSPIMKASQ